MVEAELGVLEVQLELIPSHTMELLPPVLGVAPEGLDAVDVSGASGELIVAMIEPKVLC